MHVITNEVGALDSVAAELPLEGLGFKVRVTTTSYSHKSFHQRWQGSWGIMHGHIRSNRTFRSKQSLVVKGPC